MFVLNSSIFRRVVTGGAILGAAWTFHSHAIIPLRLSAKESRDKLAALREQIDAARQATVEVKDLEQAVADANNKMKRWLGQRADSPVMAAFPDSLKEHFSRFGLQTTMIRLGGSVDEPALPGYKRVYWTMAVPVAERDRTVTGLLLAVAELEQHDRFIKVIDFSLQRDPEDERMRVANINVATLAPK